MLIGLVAKARAGKDTVAGLLTKNFDGFEQFAFADTMKDVVAVKFGIPRCNCDALNDDGSAFDREALHPFWGISVREMLQMEGTEATREVYDPDFWVKRMRLKIRDYRKKNIVISDVRFPNEVAFIQKCGGHIIGITRPTTAIANNDHPSERMASRDLGVVADYIVGNDGTIAQLHGQIIEVMEMIGDYDAGR